MIDVLERVEYTCISTIPLFRLELQEGIVTFWHLLGRNTRQCGRGAGGFYRIDRHSDSNGGTQCIILR